MTTEDFVNLGIIFGIIGAFGVYAVLILLESVREWMMHRAYERERRDVLSHPERNDLSAIIIRGQERFRK